MLPLNVSSFLKKMVTAQPDSGTSDDSGKALSKLKQIGTELMTATGNVTKLGAAKVTPVETLPSKQASPAIETTKPKIEQEKPVNRAAACRVCLKSIKPEDFSRTCYECQRKVCEDCASYSTTADPSNPNTWRCSVCRRKIAARDHPIPGQESTESGLEVPGPEGLPRRHSDARLSSQAGNIANVLNPGLIPPASPQLRRHSDVSPASLKELEKFRKVAERRDEMRFESEQDRRSKSRAGSPDRLQDRHDRGRGVSPHRPGKSPIMGEPEISLEADGDEESRRMSRRNTTRRKSRTMPRQHSYDDEIKTAAIAAGQATHPDPGLGLPTQLSRRKSAYDVYSPAAGVGLNAMGIVASQHRASMSAQGTREPEVLDRQPSSRRPSFRNPKSVAPYDLPSEEEKIINLDSAAKSDVDQSSLIMPDEELRTRRRGSQLPNIEAIRAQVSAAPIPARPSNSAVMNRRPDDRDLARQGSVADGEGIMIVIHDVDSDLQGRKSIQKKVVLRKDLVVEKGHRIRSYGMRVVGGKQLTGDSHYYARIVWTLPGGPAEKAGLKQGDKVIEWGGVSLIDRPFEDVAHIIDRSGDIVELIIEQAAEVPVDVAEDSVIQPTTEKVPTTLGLQLETDTSKTPSSPTRRKLPKTPEQLAKEKQVTGRVQIQIWYEADRKELVVSVLAADDLCAREDTGHGTAPEAFAKLDLVSPNGEVSSLRTDVSEQTHNPIWNATLNFPNVTGEQLLDRMIEVTLWDYCPDRESAFLGGCSIDLESAFESDRAVWYRLEDPRGLRSGRSPHCSPRGSFQSEIAQRLIRRGDNRERSYSEDTQSDSGSPEPYFLHPDHAYHSNSRRGSSQSEVLEIEPYELSKDYSRSLPGSRRSSFQSQQGGATDSKRGSMGDADVSGVHYSRERRRSSFARPMRDQDEILETLRNFKASKGELSRAMSLTGEKRRPKLCVVPTVTVCQWEPVSPRTAKSASFPLPHVTPAPR